MSDLGDIGKVLAAGAIALAGDIVREQISKREAARRALELAVASGVDALDLTADLTEACAQRTEIMVRAAQVAVYGRSEGDDG